MSNSLEKHLQQEAEDGHAGSSNNATLTEENVQTVAELPEVEKKERSWQMVNEECLIDCNIGKIDTSVEIDAESYKNIFFQFYQTILQICSGIFLKM